jgi:4-amino-4-deoxy-L-arabinose transferase-like glycosyltransferase
MKTFPPLTGPVLFRIGFLFLGLWLVALSWDYSLSWDSLYRMEAGEKKLQYYHLLLKGDAGEAAAERPKSSYTGLFDLTNALLRRISPLGWVETSRLYQLFFGLLTVAGCYVTGKLLGGTTMGMLAAVAVLLMPRFFGHMFLNPKDIPFAALHLWGLWGLLRCFEEGRSLPRRSRLLLFGLLGGLAMSTRIGGLLLFAYAGLAMVGWYWLRHRDGGLSPRRIGNLWRPSIYWGAAFLVGMAVLVVFWPAAHENPFARTTATVIKVSDYGWFGRVFFLGRYYQDLPWFYLPLMLLLTTPPLVLGCFALAAAAGVKKGTAGRRALASGEVRAFRWLLTVVAFLFPLFYIITVNAQVYDGVRHILFLLPLVALIAAQGGARLLQWGASLHMRGRILGTAGLALAGFPTIAGMVLLHPYQYTYYNFLAGGVRNASAYFETDYWGTAYREAYETLHQRRARKAAIPTLVTILPPLRFLEPHRADTPIPPAVLASYWVRPPFVYVPHADPADYYIATTRFAYDRMVPRQPEFTVGRRGVDFAAVFDVRELSREPSFSLGNPAEEE